MRRSSELLIIAGRFIVLLIMLAMATVYTHASKGYAEFGGSPPGALTSMGEYQRK